MDDPGGSKTKNLIKQKRTNAINNNSLKQINDISFASRIDYSDCISK